jgi:hypothetical protein
MSIDSLRWWRSRYLQAALTLVRLSVMVSGHVRAPRYHVVVRGDNPCWPVNNAEKSR